MFRLSSRKRGTAGPPSAAERSRGSEARNINSRPIESNHSAVRRVPSKSPLDSSGGDRRRLSDGAKRINLRARRENRSWNSSFSPHDPASCATTVSANIRCGTVLSCSSVAVVVQAEQRVASIGHNCAYLQSTCGLRGCQFLLFVGLEILVLSCFKTSDTCPVLAASPQLATSSRCVQVRNVWIRPVCCKKSRKKFYLNVSTHVSRNASVKPSRALAIFIQETTIHLC